MSATQVVDPRKELPIVLSKLRLARELAPGHDDNMVNHRGGTKIHIDCDVCTNQKRLNYLLDMLLVWKKRAEG